MGGAAGDGRAILLGDLMALGGQRWELQLKGAGLTPIRAIADGRAVLRSSLRGMSAAKRCSTSACRQPCRTGAGRYRRPVIRDMFYDGRRARNPRHRHPRGQGFLCMEQFRGFAARGDHERAAVGGLCDRASFPKSVRLARNVTAWFHEIARRTAVLMAHWLRDRLRAWGDEYRQPVDSWSDHRLRPLRLGRCL